MKRFSDTLSVVETEGVFKPDLECSVTLAENNQASLMVVDVVECVVAGIGMPGSVIPSLAASATVHRLAMATSTSAEAFKEARCMAYSPSPIWM